MLTIEVLYFYDQLWLYNGSSPPTPSAFHPLPGMLQHPALVWVLSGPAVLRVFVVPTPTSVRWVASLFVTMVGSWHSFSTLKRVEWDLRGGATPEQQLFATALKTGSPVCSKSCYMPGHSWRSTAKSDRAWATEHPHWPVCEQCSAEAWRITQHTINPDLEVKVALYPSSVCIKFQDEVVTVLLQVGLRVTEDSRVASY